MAVAAAIRQAVRNLLREKLVAAEILNDKSFGCELTDDGRPSVSYAGLVFIGIHGSRQTGIRIDDCFGERHGISVTVSMKTGRVQRFKVGEVVLDNVTDGMDYICDKVKVLVQTFELLPRIDALLASAGMPVQSQALMRFMSSTDPESKGPEWRNSQVPKNVTTPAASGFAKTMMFEGIETYRPLGEL